MRMSMTTSSRSSRTERRSPSRSLKARTVGPPWRRAAGRTGPCAGRRARIFSSTLGVSIS
jgi:hypothetical protein